MNGKKIFGILLALALFLGACTGGGSAKYDIAGKTFYNTVDQTGHEDHARVWFGKDGSFVMRENVKGGDYEISGKWTLKENVCTLDVEHSGGAELSRIIFEIRDEDTLILRNDIGGSRADDVFSVNEQKGSSVDPSPTPTPTPEVDPGPVPTPEPKDTFVYTTYYDIDQATSPKSYIEINKDGTFRFVDRDEYSKNEYTGVYTRNDDVFSMTYNDGGKNISFDVLSVDEKSILLEGSFKVARAGDKFSSEYKDIPCTGISSPYSYFWAVEGHPAWNLDIDFHPANTTDPIHYRSNDENVVKVDDKGNVSAIKAGNTTIDVTCGDYKLTVKFETRKKKPTSVTVTPASGTVFIGQSLQLKAAVKPDGANDQITWKSDDANTAKVNSSGQVLGVTPGVVRIYAVTVNDLKAYSEISVEGETVLWEMKDNASVKKGDKIPYLATHVSCWDRNKNVEDVRPYVEFHCPDFSVLDIDDHGNVVVKGTVSKTKEFKVYFTYTDGSSFKVTSPTYTVRVNP